MSQFTVVYDANVFYPAPLRDLLLRLAATKVVPGALDRADSRRMDAKSPANRPDLSAERITRTADMIDSSSHDCLVEGYEHPDSLHWWYARSGRQACSGRRHEMRC